MKRIKKINIEQIIARACKGFAFMQYPKDNDLTAEDFWNRVEKEVYEDRKSMLESDFRLKYDRYIW